MLVVGPLRAVARFDPTPGYGRRKVRLERSGLESDWERMNEAASFRVGRPPREVTVEVRAELDLPVVRLAPYRWAFACVVVGTACVPLVLASMWTWVALAIVGGLVVIPAVRWFEFRDASWREEVYRTGVEVNGRVTDIEPAGAGRRDHIVRVEFFAGGAMVRASVIGCALARRGLMPGEDVVIVYAPNRPARCLVVERARMEIVDAVFDN
jgi:hypothetical protein